MSKKILFSLISLLIVIGGVVAFSAFEAHVINVTAHIENALKVIPPSELVFGTVFPQEYRTKHLFITTSESFCKPDQLRVLNIDYKFVQKPKCICVDSAYCKIGEYAPVGYATDECPQGYEEMPSLCEYLSKTPIDGDLEPYDDHGVPAFHNPEDPSSIATGTINKKKDLQDEWIIDLATPCYKGYCGQDYDEFVHRYNPLADSHDYEAIGDPAGTTFGCDLWVEVTNIY